MRIIGGNFKGKKILEPKDKETRPLKDLTKESIFNIINHSNKFSIDLEKSYVLDLFSGTGSFGLECLSRESKHVIFVENYKGILPILKKNLTNLKTVKNYSIIEKNIFIDIDFLKKIEKFDIIFLDPPYKERDVNTILNNLSKFKTLKPDGIIIIHRHKKEKDNFPDKFKIIEEKKYGISKIIFGKFI
ncbi:16S rRNA (guanine(966)-N(2))-methyltransferase RsmD [Candidatus Pelagibacter communis]|uniref:16S rRNA (guanine(966)-N(2))-methyltransferase RsmD n=1 Tax=Pelagibacter ubique TaxID=198252 RepID=UPI00094DC3B8|nr:16S rRNA (guanine(966)-N(2))-methyltransferase RsmD [Candidatus Pelagibacter ubique]